MNHFYNSQTDRLYECRTISIQARQDVTDLFMGWLARARASEDLLLLDCMDGGRLDGYWFCTILPPVTPVHKHQHTVPRHTTEFITHRPVWCDSLRWKNLITYHKITCQNQAMSTVCCLIWRPWEGNNVRYIWRSDWAREGRYSEAAVPPVWPPVTVTV